MKIFFISVIEQNATYGAEVFLNRSFLALGHETHTLDFRKHRAVLPQKFLEAPEFDVLLLQRGDYFPLDLLCACRRPRFFYSSELVSRCEDQLHLFQSRLFHHAFVRTDVCKNTIVQQKWMPAERVSVLLSAFDEETHRVLPDAVKDLDVLFVGSITPRRQAMIDRLKQSFAVHSCQAFGPEMARVFNRARIALNLHAEDYLDTETRIFEALGSGAFVITETLSKENPFRNGEHLVEVKNIEEMEDRVRYYLEHEEERERIARQGHEEAVKQHSYLARARQILDVMTPALQDPAARSGPSLDSATLQRLAQGSERAAASQPAPAAPPAPSPKAAAFVHHSDGLNIGIVTTWFERGAAYVSRQYREVLQERHNVFVYARGGESAAVGNPEWDDERVTWGKPVPQSVPTAVDLNDFREWLQRHKLQVVFFNEQHWWAPIVGCCQMGIKTGAYVDYYTELTIPLFACYDFLICNTRRHHSAFDWHSQAVHVPWGTYLDVFRPTTLAPVQPGVCTFFHSAGFNPSRKGTDLLLQAFAALHGPARLVIHSQRPLAPYFPHLAPLLTRLQGEGRLECHEKTVSAPGLYHLGDVYVYPSRLDGIGLTMAEALACGLPLITSAHPPMNEFVDGSNGDLVEVARLFARSDGYYWPQCMVNVADLAKKMQKYVDERDRLEEKKAAARSYAEAHLDWTKNAGPLPDMFREFKIISPKEKQPVFRQAQIYEQRRHMIQSRG